MQKLLGFDISSAVIGWSLFEFDSNIAVLKSHGHIKPPGSQKGTLSFRTSETYDKVFDLVQKLNPDEIAIEDYAKKFSFGKSHANTIVLLAAFNEICSMAAYRALKKDVVTRYAVVSIRSELTKFFGKKIVSKDDVFPAIQHNCSKFKIKLNKKGAIPKSYFDEADAISVCLTHLKRKHPSIKNWQL